jgi:crotonobetaine/carnitine-CoA ligase
VAAPTEQQIVEYQYTGQDVPWLLAHWAREKPDHPLLVWEPKDGGGWTWTYSEFWRDVRRIAAGLYERGIQVGDKVLVHSDNSPEMVLSWYACATVGAVAVTTNTRSVGAEVNYFAEHAGCVAAITQPQYAKLVTEHAPALQWIVVTNDNSGAPATAEELDHGHPSFDALYGDENEFPIRKPEPMLPAGIMYTSGTTSRPKAVVHTHANVLWAAKVGGQNIDLRGDDKYLIYLPFFHVNAQSWSMYSAIGVGATVVLTPKWSTSKFWDLVVRHDITHISLMPFVFPAMMGAGGTERPANKLRIGVFGLIVPELEQMLGLTILPAWGMTETVTHAIHGGVEGERYPARSMGKPTAGYEALIVRPETGEICDEGETGELLIRGTRGIQIFLEYYNNPEANAKSFSEGGWFHTGDLVRVEQGGNYFYSERDKDMLKVGGENVSSREVEDICRTVTGVADVAVVGKKHDWLDQVAVASVIKAPNAPADDVLSAAVIDTCKNQLADFKVPRAVYFVEDFPRATLEKIAKNKLRDMADAEG